MLASGRRSGKGQQDAFPPTMLSNRSRLGKPTFAGVRGNDEVAPIAAIRRDRRLKESLHLKMIININPPAFLYVVARIVVAHQQ